MAVLLTRKYTVRFCTILGVSIACAIPPLIQFKSLQGVFVLMYIFGGVTYDPDANLPALILSVAPLLVTWYLLSDFLRDDLGRQAVYIFTRKDKRARWLINKMMALFLSVAGTQLASFALIILLQSSIAYCNGVSGITVIELWICLQAIALSIVFTFTFLALINVIALKCNPLYAFVSVIFFHLFSLTLFLVNPDQSQVIWAFLIPSAQGVFVWHDVLAFTDPLLLDAFGRYSVPNFILGHSFLYLSLCVLFEIKVGIHFVKRIDFI